LQVCELVCGPLYFVIVRAAFCIFGRAKKPPFEKGAKRSCRTVKESVRERASPVFSGGAINALFVFISCCKRQLSFVHRILAFITVISVQLLFTVTVTVSVKNQ